MATVIGVFVEREDADDAINFLNDKGYKPDDMSVIVKEEDVVRKVGVDESTITENTTSGAFAGGALGGVAGLLIGIGAIAVPGVGSLLIAGSVATALGLTGVAATTVSGALTGALAGGLLGLLVSFGIPETDARYYEQRIKAGAVLVLVSVDRDSEIRFIEETLRRYEAENVKVLEPAAV